MSKRNERGEELQSPVTLTATAVVSSGDVVAHSAGDDDVVDSNKNLGKPSDSEPANKRMSCMRTLLGKIWAFYWSYDFPINTLLVIGIAYAYPKFGAVIVKPKITARWIATVIIFFISGLGLKANELFKVMFHQLYFNAFVEIYNFGLVSSVVFGVSRALGASGALPQALADGLAITACLPMSINAVIILTQAAHGDEAAAIFHTAFSNMTGIFLSPILIVLYLPSITVDVDLIKIFKELTLKVIVPLIGGQLVRLGSKHLRDLYVKHKRVFMKTQEYCLIFIVYTVFCQKFYSSSEKIVFGSVVILLLFIFVCTISFMAFAWYLLRLMFRKEPKLCVMGLFGCTHKNIALGIPLILAIFENSTNVSMYALPILIWHPMQLVVGSAFVARLQKVVASETERLALTENSQEHPTATSENAFVTDEEDKVKL